MIVLDASVVVKWFKAEERYGAEAERLLDLISGFGVEAVANEWLPLEVVRGLKRAQAQSPEHALGDEDIRQAYEAIETLFRTAAIREVSVREVKDLAKDAQITLGLYAADAVHLATALERKATWLVTDDHHLLSQRVRAYATAAGVAVADLPTLLSHLAV